MGIRQRVVLFVAATFLASSCLFANAAPTRTVLVDYNSDEFPTNFTDYFPSTVQVHPGDSVVFRQSWTGEAHTVTFGNIANQYGKLIGPYLSIFEKGGYNALPPEPAAAKALDAQTPYLFDNNGKVAQNGAQPCYLTTGSVPKDTSTPCTKAQQVQPAFTGRQSWYNSGYIHYAGPTGNTFRMKIAANATPGHYFFFCLNHGPFMSGWVDIKPKSAKIASQDTLTREARKEIDAKLSVLRGTHNLALADRFPVPSDRLAAVQKLGVPTAVVDGTTVVRAWFAGLPHTGTDDASILQFVPTHPKVRVGQKVSFLFLGGPTQGHTVSFDVPAYFPVFTVEKDGTIVRNAQLDQPAGGSPKLPDSVTGGGENNNGPPPPPVVIDGGTWNGHGFFSSGLISPASFALYTLRFSKPGTYKFACLVHPLMVGTLTVTA